MVLSLFYKFSNKFFTKYFICSLWLCTVSEKLQNKSGKHTWYDRKHFPELILIFYNQENEITKILHFITDNIKNKTNFLDPFFIEQYAVPLIVFAPIFLPKLIFGTIKIYFKSKLFFLSKSSITTQGILISFALHQKQCIWLHLVVMVVGMINGWTSMVHMQNFWLVLQHGECHLLVMHWCLGTHSCLHRRSTGWFLQL